MRFILINSIRLLYIEFLDKILSSIKTRKQRAIEEYERKYLPPKKMSLDNGQSLKIIESLPSNPLDITKEKLLDAYDKLAQAPISDDALLHDNFNTFIDATKIMLISPNATSIVRIFNQICRAEIPMFDELSEMVANALLRRSDFMTMDEIISVDFSLRKYYAREGKLSKLFETLRQATRLGFSVQAKTFHLNQQPYARLIRIMRYLSNNQSLMRDIDIVSLSEQLLLKEDAEFQLNDTVCVIGTLSQQPKLDEHSKQLLIKMFRIWCSSAKNSKDVRAIIWPLFIRRHFNLDLTTFNDPSFVKHCTKLVIEAEDITLGFEILKPFNNLVCMI